MEVQLQSESGVRVLSLRGRLDELATAEAERAFLALVNEGVPRVALDLGGVEYVSSSGLRVLLMLSRALKKAEARLVLCGLSPFVAEVFEISNFTSLFEICRTRDEALRILAYSAA